MLLQNSTHFRTSRSSLHTYHMASGPLAVSFGVLHTGYAASDHVTLSRCFRNASGYVTASRRGWHTSSVASDNGSDSRCGMKAGHVASGHVIVGS